MTVVVQFEKVSKKYNLGLTRTSLPSVLSRAFKSPGRRQSAKSESDKTLWALRDVSFELERGQSLALIGANGAGKTTILKLLANITRPSAGSISLNGKLSALIELGAGFHPDLTGRENIFLNGTILGLSRDYIRRRFDEIVAFSELERFIDTPVKRYSSGMAVRLGFAVAASVEPDILLVDEVLAVGDASFRQKCLKRIQTLLNNGTSLIFVSHNLYMVQAICNRGLYLKRGNVEYVGETNKVIEAYEHDLHEERARRFQNEHVESSGDEADVEIVAVEVSGEEDLSGGKIRSDRPAQITVHYNAYSDLGNVNMAILIIRSDGLTCCMVRTKLDAFPLQLTRGSGKITLDLEPLQLISGVYFAEAWFLNESDSMALTLMGGRSEWFTVRGALRSHEETSGVYEPIARWQHDPDMLQASLVSARPTEVSE